MVKRLLFVLISILLLTVMLVNLVNVFAEEVSYNVHYKENKLEVSPIFYENDYEITFEKMEVLSGPWNYKYQVSHEAIDLPCEEMKVFPKLGEYKIKIVNGTSVLTTKEGKLEVGQNKIDVEFGKFGACYRFYINVKSKQSKRIDMEKREWQDSPKALLKWVTAIKYGQKKNKDKLPINLLDIKKYESSDCWAQANAHYYIGKKASKLYYTPNTKLILGDNVLMTEDILFQNNQDGWKDKKGRQYRGCWFRWQFTVNFSEDKPTPTPSQSVTPAPSVTDGSSNNSELPKTGESSPVKYGLIGLSLMAVGAAIFIFLKKSQKC